MALSFIETVGDADNKAGVQITNGDPRGSIKAYHLAQNRIDFEAAASIPARHVFAGRGSTGGRSTLPKGATGG